MNCKLQPHSAILALVLLPLMTQSQHRRPPVQPTSLVFPVHFLDTVISGGKWQREAWYMRWKPAEPDLLAVTGLLSSKELDWLLFTCVNLLTGTQEDIGNADITLSRQQTAASDGEPWSHQLEYKEHRQGAI